jgi:L-seryl-tRNA(Ser) seleniumtransferase
VGKEEIVGLLTALRLFLAEDPQERHSRWVGLLQALAAAIGSLPGAQVELGADPKRLEVPVLHLRLDEGAAGMSALDLVRRLQDGEPSIHASPGRVAEGIVAFGPVCLREGEPEAIGRRLRQLLGAR